MTWNYEVTHNEDGTFSIALPDGEELRIVPPKREWVGLTDEEIHEMIMGMRSRNMGVVMTEEIFREVEAKLKEKNGG